MKDDYQNPFDDDSQQFLILHNSQKQASLWPQFATIPSGWQQVFGPQSRQQCLDFVEQQG